MAACGRHLCFGLLKISNYKKILRFAETKENVPRIASLWDAVFFC